MGLQALPQTLIILGCCLECLFCLNMLIICTKNTNCLCVKKAIGGVYTIFGIVIISIAVVKGNVIGLDHASREDVQACNSLRQYNKAFLQAWKQKQAFVDANFKSCESGSSVWKLDFAGGFMQLQPNATDA